MISTHSFDISSYSSSLSLKKNRIYYADSSESISYPDDGNDNCFEIEDNSFWFRHRNNCIIEMIKNYPSPIRSPIFDVGGGNGFVSKGLLDAGFDVVHVEPGHDGAMNAKKRGITHVICGTTHTAKLKPDTIPAIGVFDVVEHIEDDIEFLNHLWELLIPGGMLYLTVPAYQLLWSNDDIDAGHFRRYNLNNIEKTISSAGFKISYSTYIFIFLPVLVFLCRTLRFRLKLYNRSKKNNVRRKNNHILPTGISGKLINSILSWELKRMKRNEKIYFGGSCMVAAQKPLNFF